MIPAVKIPITSCPQCGAPFSFEMWNKLHQLKQTPTRDSRECICGATISLPPGAVVDLGQMDAEHYAQLFPDSGLPALARLQFDERVRNRRTAAALAVVAITLIAVVVVLL